MTSRTVTVLAPNGRRQTVKCTLNTTILQILEDVCKKQGLDPIEYDIKHHNKALDTSMTVQFSGLPNNAQLELGPASKTRAESEVTVALNLEDGSRVMGTFLPSSTLEEVLNALLDNAKPNPVVIYMRRELYGDDLSKTDLRSLGLTSGRAMLRVIYKAPEELKNQANVSSVIPSKAVEEKPYKRIFQPLDTVNHSDQQSHPNISKPENLDGKISPTPKNIPAQVDILKLAKERKNADKNVVDHSKSCSTEEVLKPEKGRTFKKEGRKLNSENSTDKTEDSIPPTGATQRSQKEILDSIKFEDFPFIGDRKALIFPLESIGAKVLDDPPDEFFNLTIEDAKTILRDIRKAREESEEGGPLLTAALRELEESKKQLRQLNKYTKCIIRVLFPDRTVLQGVFSPTDSVKTVLEFVTQHLSNVNIPFYLYTTPPKFILPEDKRLIEVDCVPGALLHFGADEKFKNEQNSFIRDDLRDKYTTNSIASLAALKIREETKRDRDCSGEGKPVAGCSKEPDSNIRGRGNLDSTETVPKWFKGT